MKLKLGVVAFFFCLMAMLGVLALEDQQEPVPLPVDGAFSIEGKSISTNKVVYAIMQKLCDEKGVTVYKPIVDKDSQIRYPKLNDSKDQKSYLQVPVIGMYYSSGRISPADFDGLRRTGLQIVYQKLPWFLGGFAQFSGTLRAMLTTSLYMIFFICLLVSGSRKLKERVIWRSLGKPIIRFFADSCLPLLVNMGLTLLLALLYSHFRGNGLHTYSSQAFLAILLTNLIIFQVLEQVSLLIAYMTIKLEKPVEMIKNKLKGGSLFLIWLVMIGALIFISGQVLKETTQTQVTLKDQIAMLNPWEQVKTWQKLEPIGIQSFDQNGHDSDFRESNKIYTAILEAVKETEFLYLGASGAYVPDSAVDGGFTAQLKSDGISQPEINKRLIYINQAGAKLENAVNQTTYQPVKGKLATICLPEKYKEAQASVLKTVFREQFIGTTVTKDEIALQVIPNGQKLFYFNPSGDDRSQPDMLSRLGSRASDEDAILVILDTQLMPAQRGGALASNITNNGLFSPEAVGRIAALSNRLDFAINPVTVYQGVVLNIQSLKHQLVMAKFLQNLMLLILFICVYQYAMTLLASKQSDFVKVLILGRSKVGMAVTALLGLFLVIIGVIAITVALTGQVILILLALLLGVTIIGASIRSFLLMRRHYTQIVKGELS